MIKNKELYACQKCAYQSPKWLGRCPSCEEWNSFVITATKKENKISVQATALNQITPCVERFLTPFEDLNAVLGGGFKNGSLTLLSGEPGIGKSTLTLQICSAFAEEKNTLYVSGEESIEQISLRASRLKIKSKNINLLNERSLENIIDAIEKAQPSFVIIDSIQVIQSEELPSMAGSVNQVRYCTESLMDISKKLNITMLIIGHVTKDGELAGPKFLEHLVDTVLFIEGDRYQQFRTIRCQKNRFGSTDEISILEMKENGLKEIDNPSEKFLDIRQSGRLGSAITVTMEGAKPILLEVQALSHKTVFGYPKRTSAGYDLNRLHLLAAVISKYSRINLINQDIYINIATGLKIKDTFNDLAVAMAIASSYLKISLPLNTIFVGEIGLSGELRPISQMERRIKEAEKRGFKSICCPTQEGTNKNCFTINHIEDAIKLIKNN